MKSLSHLRVLALLFILPSCALVSPQPEKLALSPVEYADLPGWNDDALAEALSALQRSCAVILNKPAAAKLSAGFAVLDWHEPCRAIQQVPANDSAALRTTLTTWFMPYAATGNDDDGLFTGYYEASLRGSLEKTPFYQTPLYAKPDDWAEADLGDFKPELRGQKITGRFTNHKFIPYDDRATIVKNSLDGRARVLVWVDDPVDAFFLAIQGSGRVTLPDGRVVRVGFDGANGQKYVAIGRNMAEQGLLEKPVTMQKIRGWLSQHPADAEKIMSQNPSYVFFRILEGEGPIGAQGIALTPRRSLAVDPSFIPLGAPIWLATTDGAGAPFQHLMVAQDTGGAIKGAVRGDVFWGVGAEAEAQAGPMQNRGRYFLLLPRSVKADE